MENRLTRLHELFQCTHTQHLNSMGLSSNSFIVCHRTIYEYMFEYFGFLDRKIKFVYMNNVLKPEAAGEWVYWACIALQYVVAVVIFAYWLFNRRCAVNENRTAGCFINELWTINSMISYADPFFDLYILCKICAATDFTFFFFSLGL